MTARPHIVFVDDEPSILAGLRRMLRTRRDRWDMSFAEGGAAALEILSSGSCDVLVTDYRMPGMDGAALLERVRAEFPGTARVILSGQTNEENLLGIMLLAHEVLTKPANPEQLVTAVERLIDIRSTFVGSGTDQDAVLVESLPSPPGMLGELMAILDSEDSSAKSVGAVVEKDPAAAAKVLRLVNSSAYSSGRHVSNVGQAIALLGVPTVRGLVLMHDLIRTFDVRGDLPVEWLDALTLHSVETSRLCGQLTAGTNWESHAVTAGLLHEVGQLVRASSRAAEFGQVIEAWHSAGDLSLPEIERATFGVSHVETGAHLLTLWGLPAAVAEAVAGHFDAPLGRVGRAGPRRGQPMAPVALATGCLTSPPRPPAAGSCRSDPPAGNIRYRVVSGVLMWLVY
jgi:HD-like signal output (HDOD) protein/CheY-like chemotaxis protein